MRLKQFQTDAEFWLSAHPINNLGLLGIGPASADERKPYRVVWVSSVGFFAHFTLKGQKRKKNQKIQTQHKSGLWCSNLTNHKHNNTLCCFSTCCQCPQINTKVSKINEQLPLRLNSALLKVWLTYLSYLYWSKAKVSALHILWFRAQASVLIHILGNVWRLWWHFCHSSSDLCSLCLCKRNPCLIFQQTQTLMNRDFGELLC